MYSNCSLSASISTRRGSWTSGLSTSINQDNAPPVTMRHHIPWLEPKNRGFWDLGIGTSNPENVETLTFCQPLEKSWILVSLITSPCFIRMQCVFERIFFASRFHTDDIRASRDSSRKIPRSSRLLRQGLMFQNAGWFCELIEKVA